MFVVDDSLRLGRGVVQGAQKRVGGGGLYSLGFCGVGGGAGGGGGGGEVVENVVVPVLVSLPELLGVS